MKIIAILDGNVHSGGGFNQALNGIIQMQRLSEGNFEFSVVTSRLENVQVLQRLGIECERFVTRMGDKLASLMAMSEFTRRILIRLNYMSPLEKRLVQRQCDLVYFVEPTHRISCIRYLNYIATFWDDSHRDTPEFPEVRANGEFLRREFLYRNFLTSAFLVLTDSEILSERMHSRYGLDLERTLAMPFAPNPLLFTRSAVGKSEVGSCYGIEPGYFFYPAQFWAHKNHVRILEALRLLKDRGEEHRCVFCGGDAGNLQFVKRMTILLGVAEQVTFLGFVPSDHLRGLYENCSALVMPSYFGPTNIPPLEAWLLGKPLIYSATLGEVDAEAAILVDPDDEIALAEAMSQVKKSDVVKNLCHAGKLRLEEIDKARLQAEVNLVSRLTMFAKRRNVWG